jgi:hypothetical protein
MTHKLFERLWPLNAEAVGIIVTNKKEISKPFVSERLKKDIENVYKKINLFLP